MDVANDVTSTRQCVITRVVIRFLWNDVIHWITATAYDKMNKILLLKNVQILKPTLQTDSSGQKVNGLIPLSHLRSREVEIKDSL